MQVAHENYYLTSVALNSKGDIRFRCDQSIYVTMQVTDETYYFAYVDSYF
jgi:hypothetical protein